MERYIVVGGNPYMNSFTSLSVKYSSNFLQSCKEKMSELFDECGGLITIIDTKTNTVAQVYCPDETK